MRTCPQGFPRSAPAGHYRLRSCGDLVVLLEERLMAVELAELIGRLRAELSDALHAGADSDVRFELGPVELVGCLGSGASASAGPAATGQRRAVFGGVERGREHHRHQQHRRG
ncbi:trypco2 family protein [Saccharopolyspora montiporae]|uniref:trypco2 family protein n=1 Tax=Saccharopolyspora montiporae TaxID=2781240 RepID=UPI00351C02AB